MRNYMSSVAAYCVIICAICCTGCSKFSRVQPAAAETGFEEKPDDAAPAAPAPKRTDAFRYTVAYPIGIHSEWKSERKKYEYSEWTVYDTGWEEQDHLRVIESRLIQPSLRDQMYLILQRGDSYEAKVIPRGYHHHWDDVMDGQPRALPEHYELWRDASEVFMTPSHRKVLFQGYDGDTTVSEDQGKCTMRAWVGQMYIHE